jgi:hypothetical protein
MNLREMIGHGGPHMAQRHRRRWEKMKMINVNLEETTLAQLDKKTEETGAPRAVLIRRAVAMFLKANVKA